MYPKKKTMINQIFDHFNKPSYNLNDFLNLINLEFIAFCGKFWIEFKKQYASQDIEVIWGYIYYKKKWEVERERRRL
jgi:hypothetical protein